MALCSLLHCSKRSAITFRSSHFFHLHLPSVPFSSICRERSFPLPEEPPPSPKKIPFRASAHGRTWDDPFHWMSDKEDPDFVRYLREENSYAQSFMADTVKVRRKLVSEMKSRMPATIATPPERWGPWMYYQYIPEGREFPVLCRRSEAGKDGWMMSVANYWRGGTGKEEVLLDWNEIAEQYGYVHVGTCRVSPDHKFLAYTVDVTGSELFRLQIKDLERGYVNPNVQVEGDVSLAWAQNSCTLFYTQSDQNQRPCRVVCLDLAQGNFDSTVVFTEGDSGFCVDITGTKDGKFITVNSNSRTSSEVYVIDAIDPRKGLTRIFKRLSGVQFFLEHYSGFFHVLTNSPFSQSVDWSGEGYYLARCPVEDIQSAQFQNIILPDEDISFQDMDVFNGYLVLSVNMNNLPTLCSIDLPICVDHKPLTMLANLDPWFFPIPANTCSIRPGSNHDFMNPVYRAVLSSPVMPDVIVDYDLARRSFSVVHQEEIRSPDTGSFLSAYVEKSSKSWNTVNNENAGMQNVGLRRWKDFSDVYFCERKEVISHDGVGIPLTILYSKVSWQQGQSPGLLHGYGAYGEVMDIRWCPDRLSLLDRGWLVAFADVRGGGGADSSWHKSGSGFYKENSIHDFAFCGKYLINEGFVQEDQLCAIGHSAGCILMGAAANMYPGLFRAIILKVPFLDICNTLLDPTLPLTIMDYEEFGNPQILPQFESILSYSPYDNTPPGGCPPSMLITASFLDARVGVWEAAKWVAKVRDNSCSICSRSVILHTDMNAGHFSEGGYYQHLEETAYDYAFLMKVVGF